MVKIIDLHFQKMDGVIAAFLLESSIGPVLIETGPHSTIQALEQGLNENNYQLKDIKHVFVTHIHLDHAGAAWVFAEHGATIYVHPLGLPHLQNPKKLLVSANRIYQDKMQMLWSELRPIPAGQLQSVLHNQTIYIGNLGIRARHTPGHAVHHIAWDVKGMAFTGDVAGVRMTKNGPVLPPCPPPDIHVENWITSLDYLRSRRYDKIYLTHFGEVTDVKSHFIELEGRLLNWANWIKPYWESGIPPEEVVPLFEAYVKRQLAAAGVEEADTNRYALANPPAMSVAGLYRYWLKQEVQLLN